MGAPGRDTWKRSTSLLALAVAASGVWACGGSETPAEPTAVVETAEATLSSEGPAQIVAEVLEGTTLSDAQHRAIAALLTSPKVQSGEPGAAWYLAAGLEGILTAEQVEYLQAELDARRAGRAEMRRTRGDGERTGEAAERRYPAEQRSERKAEMQERRERARAAMRDALDLTDEQVAALAALVADRPARGEAREGREERREAIAAILTEPQLRAVTLHRALVENRMHGRRGGGEGAHRHRRSRSDTAP